MATQSRIERTESTWNPLTGCIQQAASRDLGRARWSGNGWSACGISA